MVNISVSINTNKIIMIYLERDTRIDSKNVFLMISIVNILLMEYLEIFGILFPFFMVLNY